MQEGKIKCHGGAFPTPFRCDPNHKIRDHLLFFYIRPGKRWVPLHLRRCYTKTDKHKPTLST